MTMTLLLITLIFTSHSLAAQPEALTPAGRAFIGPIWSPSGEYIAVSESGYQGVWLINMINGKLTQLNNANAAGFGMAWSHDGRYLATTENKARSIPRRTAVMIYDTQTGENTNLSGFEERLIGTLTWSPDDQNLFLIGHFPLRNAVFSRTEKTSPAGYNFFSILHDQIVEYNTASQVMLTLQTGQRYLNLRPSPDGQTFVCEIIGGGLIIGNSRGLIAQTDAGERPRWSADGQYIVYQIAKDDGHRITQSEIWRMTADGSELLQITDTPDLIELNPSLAPDNRRVVYEERNSRRIYTLELE
ncbi:MAG: hypothetical protein K9N11_10485 [Lentisphaeria bacterium]|nr:hypothetical protein [Candidatus Neomarinimicrobiota bacterium]MCF7843259.1 hypothetical protein [Lentisphaeria bacterium]